MRYRLGMIASAAVFGGVVLAFGLLDSYLVTALGLSAFMSCAIHGALTAVYALENWCLLKDLEASQTEKKEGGTKDMSPGTAIQNTFIEKLLRQNALLEKKNIELEARLNSYKWKPVLKRSWSLSMESSRQRWAKQWATESCLTAQPPE